MIELTLCEVVVAVIMRDINLKKNIVMKEIFLSSQKKSGLHLKVTAIHYDQCTKRKIMFFILQVLSSQIGIYAYLHRARSFSFALKKIKLSYKKRVITRVSVRNLAIDHQPPLIHHRG